MISRSLLSLLVVATATLHSCLATVVEDGIYTITLNGRSLFAGDSYNDPAIVTPDDRQKWVVRSRGSEGSAIRKLQDVLFLSVPVPQVDQQVVVTHYTQSPNAWRFSREDDGTVVISVPNPDGDSQLVVGAALSEPSVSELWIQPLKQGDENQRWNFTRIM